jgi:hypothetical protein
MKTTFRILFLILAGMIGSIGYAQEKDSLEYPAGEETFNFFGSEKPLEMELYFDVKALVKGKNNSDYQDAILTIKGTDSDSISDPVQVKARGNMRCSYCAFPPIMLKFNGENFAAGRKNTLKLVTPCFKNEKYEHYVLKEYLVYKLYNLVMDYSFNTRLVKVTYKDSEDPDKSFTAYGFLIENEDDMAGRNESVVIKTDKLTPLDMNPTDMAKVSLFNYMIGNTDWSVQGQHNVKVLISGKELTGKGIPVLYDFDYSGLVSTPYAVPFAELPIKTVSERFYQGLCMNEKELDPILDQFGKTKDKMLGTVQEFDYLSVYDKKQMQTYLNTFFSLYKNREYMVYLLNSTCHAPTLMVEK